MSIELFDLPAPVVRANTRWSRPIPALSICDHRPEAANRWCDQCDALVLAGELLTSHVCGTQRIFPPGFTWSPHSWCPACKRCHPFGELSPNGPRASHREVSPFWRATFHVQEHRPCDVQSLGRALGWPNVCELHRRTSTPDRVYWYRWRQWGLDLWTADRVATNAGLHPIEVWGDAWEQAA